MSDETANQGIPAPTGDADIIETDYRSVRTTFNENWGPSASTSTTRSS